MFCQMAAFEIGIARRHRVDADALGDQLIAEAFGVVDQGRLEGAIRNRRRKSTSKPDTLGDDDDRRPISTFPDRASAARDRVHGMHHVGAERFLPGLGRVANRQCADIADDGIDATEFGGGRHRSSPSTHPDRRHRPAPAPRFDTFRRQALQRRYRPRRHCARRLRHLAPSAANSSAIASPMPLLPPVTSALFPFNSEIHGRLRCWCGGLLACWQAASVRVTSSSSRPRLRMRQRRDRSSARQNTCRSTSAPQAGRCSCHREGSIAGCPLALNGAVLGTISNARWI